MLTDTLPASVTFVSASPGCINLGGKVVCNVGTLPSGGGSNFTVVVTPTAAGLITSTLTVTSSSPDFNAANNTAINVTTVNGPPAITVQPASQEAIAGTNVTLQVTATGTAPLAFQWRFNGTDLEGAVNAALTLRNVQAAQAGTYAVLVTNAYGSVLSSDAALNVLVGPAISMQPASQTALVGASASFSVTATGTAPLGYQWTFNDTPLAGATAATLLLAAVQPAQAGSYAVAVSNLAGGVTSAAATLTVLVPPAITAEPSNQVVVLGNKASFQVTAAGTAPLIYQWAFDGTNLTGATDDMLLLTNVQPAQAGSYAVVITNVAGSITSLVATLTVLPFETLISLSAAQPTITFPSEVGFNYVLEYKNSLDDTTWTPLFQAVAGTGGEMSLQDINAPADSRYYRVRRE
jgi:hypothetical protein